MFNRVPLSRTLVGIQVWTGDTHRFGIGLLVCSWPNVNSRVLVLYLQKDNLSTRRDYPYDENFCLPAQIFSECLLFSTNFGHLACENFTSLDPIYRIPQVPSKIEQCKHRKSCSNKLTDRSVFAFQRSLAGCIRTIYLGFRKPLRKK